MREEVLEMEVRISGGHVVLEPKNRDWLATGGIALALDTLDPRSRRIVVERWLKVNDETTRAV